MSDPLMKSLTMAAEVGKAVNIRIADVLAAVPTSAMYSTLHILTKSEETEERTTHHAKYCQ